MSLYINGTDTLNIAFPAVNDFRETTVNVNIPAGATLRFQTDSGDTGVVLDKIRVSTAGGGGSNQTIFTSQTPAQIANNSVDYELGTRFQANVAGEITAVRIYVGSAEGGDHAVRIWRASDGALLAGPSTMTFSSGTTGWQSYTLPTALSIAANTDYIVAVSTSSDHNFAYTNHGFDNPIDNGNLITYTGSGIYNETLGQMPTASYANSNYFRDIVFNPS